MTIEEQKANLRKQMLVQRAKISTTVKMKYDRWICTTLWNIIEEKDCKTVHCYMPMGTEIDIRPLIERMLVEKIHVIAPRTLPNRKLQNLFLTSLEKVEKGVFGTSHPANAKEFQGQYDLIIVPALAFDKRNHRLGYGGGYYDNFLVHHPNAYKVGIAYSFQEVKQIPLESHDVKLDNVLFV